MAKSKRKQAPVTHPARHDLTDVKVNEVSLVDKGAVPDSRFVIVKRDDSAVQTADAPEPVSKNEYPQKRPIVETGGPDSETEGKDDATDPGAEVKGHIKALMGMKEYFDDDALKALGTLASAAGMEMGEDSMHGDGDSMSEVKQLVGRLNELLGTYDGSEMEKRFVSKTEEPSDSKTFSGTSSLTLNAKKSTGLVDIPEGPPAPKSVHKSWLEEAAELLTQRERERAAQKETELEKMAFARIDTIDSVLAKVGDQVERLTTRINRATGKDA